MTLLAGSGTRDITPPIGASLAGMPTERGSARVNDPLLVKAIYFEQDDRRAVLLSMDIASLAPPLAEERRREIAHRLDVPLEAVVLCTTHTHFGPGRGDWEGHGAYWEAVDRSLLDAARDAQKTAAPASVTYAAARRDDLSHNRRFVVEGGSVVTHAGLKDNVLRPDGPIDPEIQAVLVSGECGRPMAAVVGFACHPTAMRWSDAVSADYPCWIEREVKQGFGDEVDVLFFSGALGDVADGTAATRRQANGCDLAEHIGSEVGRDAVRALRQSATHITGDLCTSSTEVAVPTIGMGRERRRWAEEVLETPGGRPGWQVRDARMILEMWREWPDEITTSVPLVAIGDLAFYGIPGELFCWYGMQLKARSRFRFPFVLGLANGRIGYIADRVFPTKDSFDTPLDLTQRTFGQLDDAGERMIRAALTL